VHGTNLRAGWVPVYAGQGASLWQRLRAWWFRIQGKTHEYVVGSHNVQIVGDNPQFYEGNVYWKIANKYQLHKILPKGSILFGEIYGDGIQDLTYGKKKGEIDVIFFDLMKEGRYVDFDDFMAFCTNNRLPVAPMLYRGGYYDGLLEEYTCGQSHLCPATMREGCVMRAEPETNDFRIGRKILKSVSEEYLLRKNGTEWH